MYQNANNNQMISKILKKSSNGDTSMFTFITIWKFIY